MKNAAKFWRNFPLLFVLQFPGKLAIRNFTQIPPHITTSNSTRLNQNSFTTIPWELVGPKYPRMLGPAVHLALKTGTAKEAYILQKPPSRNPLFFIQKNPRAHKIKSALPTSPPPKKKPKIPPPKTRNFMDMVFPAERKHFCQASIKLAQPFPAPELRTKIYTETRIFLIPEK